MSCCVSVSRSASRFDLPQIRQDVAVGPHRCWIRRGRPGWPVPRVQRRPPRDRVSRARSLAWRKCDRVPLPVPQPQETGGRRLATPPATGSNPRGPHNDARSGRVERSGLGGPIRPQRPAPSAPGFNARATERPLGRSNPSTTKVRPTMPQSRASRRRRPSRRNEPAPLQQSLPPPA